MIGKERVKVEKGRDKIEEYQLISKGNNESWRECNEMDFFFYLKCVVVIW